MDKGTMTFDEIIAKADNLMQLASDIRAVAKAAKDAKDPASPGGEKVTDEEVLAIQAKAQIIVDTAQELADEVIADLLD